MLHPNESARISHSFTADAAYAPGTRMKMSGTFGILTVAGDEAHVGTLLERTYAAGDPAPLYHNNATGTFAYIANGAIAQGAQVSSVAAGKVQTGTGGAVDLGIALNAAAADGDVIEVLPL